MKYFIGMDTSCYTTSIAVLDQSGRLVYDGRRVLEVAKGNAGLRQSDAVFQHIRNIGELSIEAFLKTKPEDIQCVTASAKPRSTEDSYMPVFTVGKNASILLAQGLHRDFYVVSHQANHILAGMLSTGLPFDEQFLAYHVSGGTTELLLVGGKHKKHPEMDISIIGGSDDLKAGQFIDRVGVGLGLVFPCGREMDKLCGEINDIGNLHEEKIPTSIKGSYLSFSGPESHVRRLMEKGGFDTGSLCRSVFMCIAKSLEKTLINTLESHTVKQVLFVGGVASNRMIKNYMENSRLLKKKGLEIRFADPRYASDNAIGSAYYGLLKSGLRLED